MKTKALQAVLLAIFFAQGEASKQPNQVPVVATKTNDLCDHDWQGTHYERQRRWSGQREAHFQQS